MNKDCECDNPYLCDFQSACETERMHPEVLEYFIHKVWFPQVQPKIAIGPLDV